jgi:hypothetical protein
LYKNHLLPNRFAANHWHQGVNVSYAADNVADYLGTPLPCTATSMMEQLQGSSAAIYLRWRGGGNPAPQGEIIDAFVPAAPWRLVSTIAVDEADPVIIDVYARSKDESN